MKSQLSNNLVTGILQILRLVMRILFVSLVGILMVVSVTDYCSYAQIFMQYSSPRTALIYQRLAYSYLLILLLGVLLVGFGLVALLNKRREMIKRLDSIPLRAGALIPYVLSQRRYSRLFVFSSLLYGLFYSFITSIIVYQPEVSFSEVYLANIPSVLVTPCCGPPLYVPVTTVYLAEHLGLLLLPLSLILLIIVSTLVGLNLTLTVFSYGNRPQKRAKGLFGGMGAVVGLFTGCPTCAGLFLANIVGGAGATSFAILLSHYQTLFIG